MKSNEEESSLKPIVNIHVTASPSISFKFYIAIFGLFDFCEMKGKLRFQDIEDDLFEVHSRSGVVFADCYQEFVHQNLDAFGLHTIDGIFQEVYDFIEVFMMI